MKILIGLDDSPHAQAVLDFVGRFPWPERTHIVAASAVHRPVAAYAPAPVPSPAPIVDAFEEELRLHREQLERVARTLRDSGFEAETVVLQGDPRDALVYEAQQRRVDLVIVGSHGRSGLSKLLLGSVASHVMAHAPCSVLVVKRDEPEA